MLADQQSNHLLISYASLCIFIDLAKAFDTVNHRQILDVLELNGVRGLPQQLFCTYLIDRKQQVKIGVTISAPRVVECGVRTGLFRDRYYIIFDLCQ